MDPILPIIEASSNHYTINTSVIFDKEKAKLHLDSDETRLYNVMKANVDKMEIETPYNDSKFFVSVDSIKSKYRVLTTTNKRPYVDMKIKLRGVIEETLAQLDPDKLKLMKKPLRKHAKPR